MESQPLSSDGPTPITVDHVKHCALGFFFSLLSWTEKGLQEIYKNLIWIWKSTFHESSEPSAEQWQTCLDSPKPTRSILSLDSAAFRHFQDFLPYVWPSLNLRRKCVVEILWFNLAKTWLSLFACQTENLTHLLAPTPSYSFLGLEKKLFPEPEIPNQCCRQWARLPGFRLAVSLWESYIPSLFLFPLKGRGQ